MGLMAIIVFAINWMPGVRWAPALLPILSSALFSVFGQLGLMQAIKYAEPSRVSPLLTVKLFFPALLATLIGQPVGAVANRSLNAWQWLAVSLCVIAGISINESGGRMRPRALVAVLFTATVFAGSDWSIGLAVAAFLRTPHMNVLRASLLTESGVFLLLAVIAAVCLPFIGRARPRDWRDALPFAIAWFSSMIFLFFAFGQLGVVLGSILQCTRGFMTIVIGIALMYLGLEHIEPSQPRAVVLRRLAAGFLMFIAITLYIIRDPLSFKSQSASAISPKMPSPNFTPNDQSSIARSGQSP
jgi:drug/metabolite transporter (DMT)-like permease